MSQVIIEIGNAVDVGGSSIVHAGAVKVEEITSSGTSQATTITTRGRSVVTIINNGTDAIWVNFGATAAVASKHFIAPNTQRDFGGTANGQTVNVINDS